MPFISANTDFSGFQALQNLRNRGRIADSVVVTKGGQQIGIIGVTTPEVPNISSPGAVKFNPNVAGIVNAEAQRLTNAGVNKIVLSSHLQDVNFEKTLVKQLHNIDAVVSGGGDELLANSADGLVPLGTPPTRPTGSSRSARRRRGRSRSVPTPRPPSTPTATSSRSSPPRASTATSGASRWTSTPRAT